MKGRIRRLPQGVVDRIAAGEVVERPASVVKELVENAIDAGATRVEVEIEGGGAERIVVRDDGVGMGPDDLELAFASHATSKLSDVGDLDHIASFGFRGEALASIGAVADCRILSREREPLDGGASEGHEVESRGGRVTPVVIAAAPPGTQVDVRHLFKYVPARRKFLRATSTESSHVTTALEHLALANPGVGFALTRDGRTAFRVLQDDDVQARLERFFGPALAGSLIALTGRDGELTLTGFAAPPEAARGTATGYHLFLNGRTVRDRSLSHAVRHAYEGLLQVGRHPVVFLFLTMDPKSVDVNVHPAKLEVRFHQGERVHRLVRQTLRAALLGADLAPNPLAGLAATAPAVAPVSPRGDKERYLAGVRDALADFLVAPHERPHPDHAARAPSSVRDLPAPTAPAPRPVRRYLQVRDLFLVYETDDGGVAIADQHALHERILLEELRERVRTGGLEVQPLLVPAVIELPAADVELLAAEADALAALGVRVGRFGPTSIAVHSLPTLLSAKDPERLLGGILDRLRVGRGAGSREHLLESILHSMACRAAVMSGDPLTEDQARELMRQAGAIDTSQSCAHGRPTVLKIPFAHLERHFGR